MMNDFNLPTDLSADLPTPSGNNAQNAKSTAATDIADDSNTNSDSLARWRLILGRYSDKALSDVALNNEQMRLERSLDYLYNREYDNRGDMLGKRRGQMGSRLSGQGGSLDDSQLTAINWLNQAQDLFPKSTFERVQNHAFERYQLTSLLKNDQVLEQLEPTPQLAKTLLSLRGRLSEDTRDNVRRIIQRVVDDIVAKLRPNFVNAIQGRRNRFRRSFIANSQNFDWRRTIATNLKHYNQDLNKIIIREPVFNARVQRHLPWTVVLCVDQSASMLSSVMYSAICASILTSLPAVTVKLLVFDTNVVDLSYMAHDSVEVLLTVQLGGGTNIAKAVQYAETLITEPTRTIFALISDFEEGGSVPHLLSSVARMHGQKVKLIGLGALDESANSVYDIQMAQKLSEQGMQIAALTPEHFAEWIAEVIN